MNSRITKWIVAVVAVAAGQSLLTFVCAQQITEPHDIGQTNAVKVNPVLPLMPPTRSPVDFFRELLNKNPVERLEFLSNRPPASRTLILAKVREYEQLKPEECELRLRVTELHYYLLPLMSGASTNRVDQLALIPADTRKLVADRLEQWDKLPSESQKDLLQNVDTLRALMQLASSSPAHQKQVVTAMTDAEKAELEAGIRKWQDLSGAQRRETITHFKEFFDLTPQEKDKALGTLSEPERLQLEHTLVSFENLTPTQRGQCVRSFEKFASLSAEERQQFLKSAERWKAMSPSDRQLWKDLVYNLGHQPPVPQGVNQPPQPRPQGPPIPGSHANMAGTN